MMKSLLFSILLLSPFVFGALSEPDRSLIPSRNLLTNPGFELNKSGWSFTGGGVFNINTTTAHVGSGKASASWDASASGEFLRSLAYTIPAGAFGQSGVASCNIKGALATHTLQVYDGTNVIAEVAIQSLATYSRTSLNFIFPSSGTIQLRLKSNANEPLIYVDDCHLGLASGFNISQNSQAQFIGSASFTPTAACGWTRSSATLGAFTADTDCPGPTVEFNPGPGTIQTTDTDLPKVTVNSLPPGYYEVKFMFHRAPGNNDSFAINDGTTTSGYGGADTAASLTLVGYFNYTNSGNRTFELYGASDNASAITVYNSNIGDGWRVSFSIVRYPSTSEQTYTQDKLANSWEGVHESDCNFTSSSSSWADLAADASCTFTQLSNENFGTVTSQLSGSDKLPGIVFTPSRIGTYEVCATIHHENGSSAATSWRFSDGTITFGQVGRESQAANGRQPVRLCGYYRPTSIAAKTIHIQVITTAGTTFILTPDNAGGTGAIYWSLKQIDQSFPAVSLACEENEIWMYGGAGAGSVNTSTREYTTTGRNVGTAMTMANSSTLGMSVTVNRRGIYSIQANEPQASGNILCITKNSTDTVGTCNALTDPNVTLVRTVSGNSPGMTVPGIWLAQGDVIRVQGESDAGLPNTSDVQVQFRMVKQCP